MALLFVDGFDNYLLASDMLKNKWATATLNTNSGFTSMVAGRFGGLAANMNGAQRLSLTDNLQESFVGFAYYATSVGSPTEFTYYDGTNPLVKLIFDYGAGIVTAYVYTTVTVNTTVLGASLPASISANTWQYIELSLKVSTTDGKVVVRVNNAVILNLTSLNTRRYTTNNYSNLLAMQAIGYMDDLYVCSTAVGTGSRPMNTFLGDKRVYTMYPKANSSVQFTPVASVLVSPVYTDTVSYTVVGNRAYCSLYTTNRNASGLDNRVDQGAIISQRDCVLTSYSVRVFANVPAVKIRPIIYVESTVTPDTPGALLATGDEKIGLVAGDNYLTYSTPPTLEKGKKYYLGFIADSGFVLRMNNSIGNGTMNFGYIAATYPTAPSSFSVASATNSGALNQSVPFYTTVSTNYGNVQETQADNDNSYNYSGTNGDKDLFTSDGNLASNATVWAVQLTGSYAKDDANTRTMANLLKSGATEVQGTDFNLGGSYAYKTDVFPQNPNTAGDWSVAAVNSALIGYKITS